jgi:arylsulfatase A-like enzyme/Flp pilus assembly protein TadD
MKRFLPLSPVVSLLVVALAGCPGARHAPSAPQAPVVLISIDTLRADHLPAYGYRGVATPAIDRLRRDAVLFGNAYTSAPLTLPSHCSILTGLPPAGHGVRDNIGYRLDTARTPTLADRLRRHGYATGAAVSAYVLRAATGLGASFDRYDDGIEFLADQTLGQLQRAAPETTRAAEAWIDAHRTGPFFYFVHYYEPHTPYEPPEPWKSRYKDRPYDGEIATVDASVGELLDHLRRIGVYDRAVILLLADHGEGLGDHGEKEHGILLYRETIRVPLLLKLPGGERAGARIDAPAELLDVVPTVLGVLGLEAPAELPGRSLLDLDHIPARRLYSETFYPRLHFGWSPLAALSGARYAYIEGPDPELYDLAADPGERANVLARERRVYADMKAELATHAAALVEPGKVGGEEAAKLAALGYAARPVRAAAGPLPDPKKAVADLPRIKRAYEMAAAGDRAGAIAILSDLVRRYPAMLDARFQLASNLAETGHYDEALAEYDKAIEFAPSAADGMLMEKARIYLKRGRLDEAERYARAAMAGLPAEGHELLGSVALARGALEPALAEAEAAVKAEPVPRADSLLLLAQVHLKQNEPAPALALLEPLHQKVAAGRPPIPSLEFLRGDALARAGRNDEAERAFRDSIRLYPRDWRAYSSLAFLYASERRGNDIEPLIQAMVAANPGRDTYLAAASTVERLGDAEGARAWRRRAGMSGP